MERMPVLFTGHGSPMNAIEDNSYTRNWRLLAAALPCPAAILAISAHWVTDGLRVNDAPWPRMVYDMYGFPEKLYQVQYAPPGTTCFARLTADMMPGEIKSDRSWGIDHGTWSVLRFLYPDADIPVFQLSIDANRDAAGQFAVGRALEPLREQGVLILGSGNVVHNLSKVNWQMRGGYAWADAFDAYIKENVRKRDYPAVIDYWQAGACAEMAFVTREHFDPLLCVLGVTDADDDLCIYNDSCTLGALSMTSYLFQQSASMHSLGDLLEGVDFHG